jgi:hypothetical protein
VIKKKGSCAFAYAHKTRVKTTIVLNTISTFGVVNIKVKRLRALIPSKER